MYIFVSLLSRTPTYTTAALPPACFVLSFTFADKPGPARPALALLSFSAMVEEFMWANVGKFDSICTLRCLISDFLSNLIIWPLFVPLSMSLMKSKHAEPL
jgi:hypothetical protein